MTEADTSQQRWTVSAEVIAQRIFGTIKWFNFSNGYGFIQPVDPKLECIFVHQTAFVTKYGTQLRYTTIMGKFLEFDVISGEKGSTAANVTGIGGLALFEIYPTKFKYDRRKRELKCRSVIKLAPLDNNNNSQLSDGIDCYGSKRWSASCYNAFHPYRRSMFSRFYSKRFMHNAVINK